MYMHTHIDVKYFNSFSFKYIFICLNIYLPKLMFYGSNPIFRCNIYIYLIETYFKISIINEIKNKILKLNLQKLQNQVNI